MTEMGPPREAAVRRPSSLVSLTSSRLKATGSPQGPQATPAPSPSGSSAANSSRSRSRLRRGRLGAGCRRLRSA